MLKANLLDVRDRRREKRGGRVSETEPSVGIEILYRSPKSRLPQTCAHGSDGCIHVRRRSKKDPRERVFLPGPRFC